VIVLDTSFLVAFHNRDDVHHAAAVRAMDRLVGGEWGVALLPEYVFLELVTLLLLRRNLSTAVEVAETLLRAREVELVPCSELFIETWRRFREQGRKKLSFTDAAILAVAAQREAEAIATFDRALARASGLRVVP